MPFVHDRRQHRLPEQGSRYPFADRETRGDFQCRRMEDVMLATISIDLEHAILFLSDPYGDEISIPDYSEPFAYGKSCITINVDS